eukprot:evm.model.scf_2689.1 EVM.evm.TU.scf_2689.1   scf_2689:6497-7918(+)
MGRPAPMARVRLRQALLPALACAFLRFAAAQPIPPTSDAQLLRVAELIPEFGGMFFDDDGGANVFLVGGAEVVARGPLEAQAAVDRVAGALSQIFGPGFLSQVLRQIEEAEDDGGGPFGGPEYSYSSYSGDYPYSYDDDQGGDRDSDGVGAPSVRILDARFSLLELDAIRRSISGALGDRDVAYTDLDEGANAVTVGVTPGPDPEAVLARLAGLGIAPLAINVEVAPPIVEQQGVTLRTFVRPTPGGSQISEGRRFCTLGFNALLDGFPGFVTNSHCSRRTTHGALEGTIMGSPRRRQRLGVEAADPAGFRGGGCPPGRRCRMSDSAFFSYDDGVAGFGITRTVSVNRGTLEVNRTSPVLEIGPGPPAVAVGTLVEKVGRTTGWTRGRVLRTCVDYNIPGRDITYLCQTMVARLPGETQPYSGGGDSGAPVFVRDGPGPVTLAGIHWGGEGDAIGVFSPLEGVRRDLGGLVVR